MNILEIDEGCTHFRVLDGDKIIVESYFIRMNSSNGIYIIRTDDCVYEIPRYNVIIKRKTIN